MSHQEEAEQVAVSPAEWGERFVVARENLGLSQEQAAQDLNLPLDYVRFLEIGSLEGLPSMVFAKGYIRAYAKLLNLADDELVHEFQEIHGEGSCKEHIGSVSRVREQVKMNHPVMKISSGLFIVLIVVLSLWWWQTQDGGSFELPNFVTDTQVTAETEQTLPADEAVAQVNEDGSAQLVLPKLDDALPKQENLQNQPQEADESSATEQTASESEAESEAEPQYLSSAEIKQLQQRIDAASPEASETVAAASAEATPAAAPASDSAKAETPVLEVVSSTDLSQARLSIDFVAECWVSVKDANGKNLFNNLRGQGQSVNVSGQAPFNILIGAADAVGRFSFNGEEMDLAPHSRKNIVRINLPLAE